VLNWDRKITPHELKDSLNWDREIIPHGLKDGHCLHLDKEIMKKYAKMGKIRLLL